MSVIPAFVFAVLLGTCSVGGLEEQTCDVSKRSYVIQPDAQAYIGVVMAMHESAKSMYGCGAALDTMKTYEAMRWALGRINQNSGHLNGEAVSESYIPGVKIGESLLLFQPIVFATELNRIMGSWTGIYSFLYYKVVCDTICSLISEIV